MANVVDVWTDFKKCFSQGDLVHISKLKKEIYEMQQKYRLVTGFYSTLKN